MKKMIVIVIMGIFFLSACRKSDLRKSGLKEVATPNNEVLSEPPPCPFPSITMSTLAGNGTSGYVDGAYLSASFHQQTGIALSGSVLYVGHYRYIRQLNAGTVSTLYTMPRVEIVRCVATDRLGNVYAGTSDYVIRKISPAGVLLATYGQLYYPGFADGIPGTFTHISGISIDRDGIIYVSELGNSAVRRINPGDGKVTTIAGKSLTGTSLGYGYIDGSVWNAKFGFLEGIAVNAVGDSIYVLDEHSVRLITGGNVSTIAGRNATGHVDGDGPAALFYAMSDIAIDESGNAYVTEKRSGTPGMPSTFYSYLRKIIKMPPSSPVRWKVSTLAGGVIGYADGSMTTARFYNPAGIVITPDARMIYFNDGGNHRVRKVSLSCGTSF